jgi:hypothetical protein
VEQVFLDTCSDDGKAMLNIALVKSTGKKKRTIRKLTREPDGKGGIDFQKINRTWSRASPRNH